MITRPICPRGSPRAALLTAMVAVCFSVLPAPAAGGPSVHWVCTTAAAPWQEMPVALQPPQTSPDSNTVTLDPKTVYQSIDGFGGCFNELGWDALQPLDSAGQATALKSLFDISGCNFNLCRAPIGANDFARDWYSLDETAGDFALTNFSIERDRRILIAYMKAAMLFQPKLTVWGVPWSPPSWMKTDNAYKGGNMKQDPQTLAAYALYFSKYVQAYRREGINLYAIHPQNEPKYNNNVYPQCAWTGQEINTFLRDYLCPRLKQDHVEVEVWLGTIVNENLADYIDPVLADSVTAPAITGIGYQWGGQTAMLATHTKYPAKKMMQTETECNNGADSWEEGTTTFRKIIEDMNHFANGYMFWNMILSEKSTSSWGWKQNSLLKIDGQNKQIINNPEFYSMKHFSHFVQPGAVRIGLTSPVTDGRNPNALQNRNTVAFRNPSGELILVTLNPSANVLPVTVQSGSTTARIDLPAHSMNTVAFEP